MLDDSWRPLLLSVADRKIQMCAVAWAARDFGKPRMPHDCIAIRRRRGPGGVKLTRKRLIKKWFTIRTHTSFPKGPVSRKMVHTHQSIFWMYYGLQKKGGA